MRNSVCVDTICQRSLILDASRSFVNRRFVTESGQKIHKGENLNVKLPTGRSLTTCDVVKLDLLLGKVVYPWQFYVLDMSMPMILGIDFCREY